MLLSSWGRGARAVLLAPGAAPARGQADAFGGLRVAPGRQEGTEHAVGCAAPTELLRGGGNGGGGAGGSSPIPCAGPVAQVPAAGGPHPSPPSRAVVAALLVSWCWLPAVLPCRLPYATPVALSSEIPTISRLPRCERDVSEQISSPLSREERSTGWGLRACSLGRPHGGDRDGDERLGCGVRTGSLGTGDRWAGQLSRALHHCPLAMGLTFIPIASRRAGLFHLETLSAAAASHEAPAGRVLLQRVCPRCWTPPASPRPVSPYVSVLGMGETGCPDLGEGLPSLGIAVPGSPVVASSLRSSSLPSSPFGMLFNSTSASCILASWHAACFYFSWISAWMTKPVDYLFFFTRHPPASRGLPHQGGIWGSHPHCGSLVLTLFPNCRLSLETLLNLAGKIKRV